MAIGERPLRGLELVSLLGFRGLCALIDCSSFLIIPLLTGLRASSRLRLCTALADLTLNNLCPALTAMALASDVFVVGGKDLLLLLSHLTEELI